jgi:hypothetical protein
MGRRWEDFIVAVYSKALTGLAGARAEPVMGRSPTDFTSDRIE